MKEDMTDGKLLAGSSTNRFFQGSLVAQFGYVEDFDKLDILKERDQSQ
jgi:hypothetical protein